MNNTLPLNLFYEEPDPDRWLPLDRYPRGLIRRLYRGKPQPRGHFMVFNNLIKGLEKLQIPYRVNNYRHARQHPDEIVGIIGKDQVLFDHSWKNPIVLGASIGINPINHPDILTTYPNIKRILVPGQWSKELFAPYGDAKVTVWPVGTDTEEWKPSGRDKPVDFLLYNKVMWDKENREAEFVTPLKNILKENNLSYVEIKYGHYKPADLKEKLEQCQYAIFLCEHETQGIACQQILAAGLPVLAWDKGGYWEDPYWYPHQIQFQPVTSVPYWDERCGLKFSSLNDFQLALTEFIQKAKADLFAPRYYILENLTLEKCAQRYVDIINSAINDTF